MSKGISKAAERRQRAAEHFGALRQPRVSVDVGDDGVFLVWRTGSSSHAAFYSERYGRPHADHIRLTRARADRMIEALEAFKPEQPAAPARGEETA